MSDHLTPDLIEAEQFLSLLDPNATAFTFQTFDDSKQRDPQLAGHRSGTLEQHAAWLEMQNNKGAGVFVTVQETDLKGRSKPNIKRIRAIYQEDDGDGLDLPTEPHIITESSPGKYHRYILVNDAPLDEFEAVQNRLVVDYGSDPNAKDRARVLRLPGFYHRKAEPHLVTITHESGKPPIDWQEVKTIFPPYFDKPEKSTAINGTDGVVIEGNRNTHLTSLGGTMRRRAMCHGAIEAALLAENPDKCKPPLSDDDVKKIAVSVARYKPERPISAVDDVVSQVSKLPEQPEDLLHLPFMLEDLQAYIVGRMTYPSLSTAGIAALATMTAFVQTNITIKSRDGLGFNEQYMILAPTGFGKEDITKPLVRLMRATDEMQSGGNLSGLIKTGTEIHFAAPSSMQGLHQDLEANNSVYYLSDEFAGWLKTSHTDGHKAQALNYLMQIYTKALSTVHPGAAVTKKYEPVKNPRVGILATNTAESMFESLSREQAESGAYNRWIMFVSDEELPPKRYTGLIYEPDPKLVDYFAWLRGQTGIVTFSASGFERYIDLDSSLAEPVKRRDALLGGRLSEQAIKLAGLIALSDKRFTIEPDDIQTAFNIRMGIYHRAAALAQHEGSLSGLHVTGEAVRQITEYLRKKPSVYRSRLGTVSRKFNKLSVAEQNAVLNALYDGGIASHDKDNRKIILSEVYQG